MKARVGDVVVIRDRGSSFSHYYGELAIVSGYDSGRGYFLQTSEHGGLGILSHQGIEVVDHLSFDDLPTDLQIDLTRKAEEVLRDYTC